MTFRESTPVDLKDYAGSCAEKYAILADRGAGFKKERQVFMLRYICNHPHPWFNLANCRRALLTMVAALACVSPASAQTPGRTNSNGTSAALHISVFVVPTVMSAPKSAPLSSINTVSYNVTTQATLFSTTQEVRAYSPVGIGAAGRRQSGLLKTTTTVLR